MKHRLARVAEILKRELSVIILREVPADGALITVNAVDVSPDLRNATVHVGILGTASQQKQVLERLEQHRAILQTECSKRVVLKFTPHLRFRLDESIERGTRVLDILDELETGNEEART
jgi:ribosome-binding factor A